jgi:excisionase family DNA binding protein
VNAKEFEPLFVRPGEVAQILRISRAKAYQLIASGALPSVRIGSSLRVPLGPLRQMAVDATAKGGTGGDVN